MPHAHSDDPSAASNTARRAVDLLAAAVIGLITAPIWALTAAAVRFVDGAPVLHRAMRVGRGGACFTLYKFRTMGSSTGPSVTAHGDRRITRTGSFLRRTKIDELPQLWNVARGDMSLVGPRPEDPRYVERYSHEQRRLLAVAPGLTSPATIAYHDEEAILANYPDPERAYLEKVLPAKLALDLAWLDRRSVRADVRVLVATVRALFVKGHGSNEALHGSRSAT
jgi:lipopolysaccharide/colanic/teichoic acid biosynthesis glycosyltransferase